MRILKKLIPTLLVVAVCLWLVERFISPSMAALLVSPFVSPEMLGWRTPVAETVDTSPFLDEICKTPYKELTSKNKQFILTVDGKEFLCTYALDDGIWSGYSWGNDLSVSGGIIENKATKENDIARKITVTIEPHIVPGSESKDSDRSKEQVEYTFAAVPSNDWYVLLPFDEYEKQELALEAYQKEQKDAADKAEKRQKEKENDDRIPRAN